MPNDTTRKYKYTYRSRPKELGEDTKKVYIRPREGMGKMDDEDLRMVLESVIQDAEDYADDELGPDREKATDYYKARPFGNEEDGRSQIVLSEVRDAVTGMLPSLLRVFTGPEHVVEFVPKNKDGVQTARLMTDAIRNKFQQGNGWLKLYAFLLDGLVRRIGAFSWSYESRKRISVESFSGLTEEQLNVISEEEGVEVKEKEEDGEAHPESGPAGGQYSPEPWVGINELPPEVQQQAVTPVKLYKGLLKRTHEEGDVDFDAIPPNELIFSRTSRTPYDTLFIGRRMRKTRGELLSMGYTEEQLEGHMSLGRLGLNQEVDARNPEENNGDPEGGEENEESVYFEGYIRIDYEGEGIDVYKVCALGDTYYPLFTERAEEVKLAVWSPYPEPHTLVGDGLSDRTMDLQLLKSALARGILDSLSASIFPRMAYIEGMVNPEDILNTEIGGPLRVKNTSSIQNALQAFEVPFAGEKGLALLQYVDAIRESRTGRANGPDGLDADALQSTEKSAAKAAITAAQLSTEMVARVAAEQGLKPLFRGLMREMIRHQPAAYMTKVRDEWVEVDPRVWKSEFDVQVNIALGAGLTETKLISLDKIIGRISGLLTQSPDNPLASWVELRHALGKEAELLGYKDVGLFYKNVTEEQLRAIAEARAQQPPPPSPEQMLAEGQIEAKRIEVEGKLAIERDRLDLDERVALMTDDRERDKNEASAILARMGIESKYRVTLNKMEIDTAIEHDRQAYEKETAAAEAEAATAQAGADAQARELDASLRVFEATSQGLPAAAAELPELAAELPGLAAE